MTIQDRFTNRIVLVSGSASGIGKAAALAFAREGGLVIGADRDEAGGQAVVVEIEQAGGRAEFVRTDISNEDDINTLIEGIVKRHGRLDVAFNNAGLSGEKAPLAQNTRENWDRVIAINLTGTFLAMRAQLRVMLAQGKGAIVNTTSIAGLGGPSLLGPYAASKWGIIGLTKVAASEHARFGIRVNAIAPGYTLTAMANRSADTVAGWHEQSIAGTPMHRGGKPEEIVRAALWLASEEASFVTGQTLAVDGGYTIGGASLEENPLEFSTKH